MAWGRACWRTRIRGRSSNNCLLPPSLEWPPHPKDVPPINHPSREWKKEGRKEKTLLRLGGHIRDMVHWLLAFCLVATLDCLFRRMTWIIFIYCMFVQVQSHTEVVCQVFLLFRAESLRVVEETFTKLAPSWTLLPAISRITVIAGSNKLLYCRTLILLFSCRKLQSLQPASKDV